MGNKTFTVNGTVYGSENVLVIAELGTSHGGSPEKARELVDAAADAGADCIKFQIVYADEILHPNTGDVDLPGGRMRLYDTFKKLEVDISFYRDLKGYVESRGLLFLASPFGMRSARELWSLKPGLLKIASPELNYTGLLTELASYGLPALLSTGVSRLSDIETALELFPPERACLLHCVTAYPAPEGDYNLRVLRNISSLFGVPVGVSDHSLDPELVPSLAVVMGAVVIEKHFCLSREDSGLDDPIALTPQDFKRMVQAVRRVSVLGAEATLDALKQEQGEDTVEAVLGDGVKRLARAERANYLRTNRSVHANRDIQAGETLVPEDFAVLRTEKILRPGLHPSWESRLVGRKTTRFIPSGEGIVFEDLI
ncbi:NeuB family protein [Treponema primitia ZAS-2]|uniref:NeuB family protein n=1 Tax=Treponema primitia (strain ATCC BAA-887 / DSM 12427 / ZAS-2) TaxID=545694 RepID=F5YGQ9_TREPZ|nr:N-acetylneuraminate synthase family protein [Treponema primitia]AEF86529.1 NeuB family protein [Treponema primitia ZAS-2]